jgi:peroxiredoxin Q/BCP
MKVNDRVEDFSSVDQDGNAVRLSEMLKSGPLVLFFYPKAMTTG